MENHNVNENVHKEMAGQIEQGEKDRLLLSQKLEVSINPRDITQHPEGSLINTATGAIISQSAVNVDDSLLGKGYGTTSVKRFLVASITLFQTLKQYM